MSTSAQQQICAVSHNCGCGGGPDPHVTGAGGCYRYMTAAPRLVDAFRGADENALWVVDGSTITEFTMKQQRGYHQHKCGCWSRWHGSDNTFSDGT